MRKTLPVVATLAILALALSTQAAIFLNIEGFKSENPAKGHPGAIIALRFDLLLTPESNHVSHGDGVDTGLHRPITVTKVIDNSSPELLTEVNSKKEFKTVTLELTRPEKDGKESVYYTIKLTRVTLASIHQYIDEQTKVPVEDLLFIYDKIEIDTPGESSTPAETPVKPHPIFRLPNK